MSRYIWRVIRVKINAHALYNFEVAPSSHEVGLVYNEVALSSYEVGPVYNEVAPSSHGVRLHITMRSLLGVYRSPATPPYRACAHAGVHYLENGFRVTTKGSWSNHRYLWSNFGQHQQLRKVSLLTFRASNNRYSRST